MTDDFDALWSVSDLHLGGETGFQSFDRGPALGGLVDHVRTSDPGGRVALVLNGDVVDFLAEREASYLDPQGAVDKLRRIVQDPAFAPAFDALRRFVATPRRRLVLVLGNHDVELALPAVRKALLDALCGGGDDDARGRIVFAVDGAGFACRVAGARVLCVHGNEADGWNVVDYDRLLAIAQAQNRCTPAPAWVPSPGTRLVIDVMNGVKRDRAAWVDLLKPEIEGVVPLLLALDPERARTVREFLVAAARAARDRVGRAVGLLAAGDGEADSQAMDRALFDLTVAAVAGDDRVPRGGDAVLADVEAAFRRNPDGFAHLDGGGEVLLGWSDLTGWLRRLDRPEAVRRALQQLGRHFGGFDEQEPDDTSKRLSAAVGADVDFLIAGHTHLAKALPRTGGGCYLNSGTWIRLIPLVGPLLDDPGCFRQAWPILEKGSMEALDACTIDGPNGRFALVQRLPHVVHVARAGAVVRGELLPVDPESGEPGAPPSGRAFDVPVRSA